eukprot:gene16442-18652_t
MSSEASNSGRGLSAVKDEGKEGKVSSNPVIRALSHLRAHRITEIQFFLFASKTMRHPSNRAMSIRRASAASCAVTSKNECGANKKEEDFESCNLKTEETRLPETNANSRADSVAFINPPSMSEPRHITPEQPSAKAPEVAGSTKLSSKIIAYLSGKLNSVMPAIENLDENDIQDYEQLAALSAGGVMNTEMEEALEARFGMDVESSEVVQSEDNEYNEEVVVVTETNDII